MNAILKQLLSPEWWFSVVVTGLLVGMLAPYLGKVVIGLFSRFSARAGQIFSERAKVRKEKIQLFSDRLDLLSLEYQRLIFRLILCAFFFSFSFIMPVWVVLQERFPGIDPTVTFFGLPTLSLKWAGLLSLVFAGAAMVLWFQVTSGFEVCDSARKRGLRAAAAKE
jgi:hypothetical protein